MVRAESVSRVSSAINLHSFFSSIAAGEHLPAFHRRLSNKKNQEIQNV
jgi:hypothetical protein